MTEELLAIPADINIEIEEYPRNPQINKQFHEKAIQSNKNKRISQQIWFMIFRLMSFSVMLILILILGFIVVRGIGVVNLDFITKFPEDGLTKGGILPAIVGTLCLITGSILFAFPVGLLSAIYTAEYAKNNWLTRFIRIMTNNLGGVPSIVFGLFGMSLFVNTLGFGDSILAGSLTLGLLILPVIIRTSEEAFFAIDDSYRHGSFALGATKLQTIRRIIFPMAFPNILSGVILSVGRVSGETAPILFTVAAYFLPHLPHSIFDQVMALPYHLYVIATSGTNIEASRGIAYGTALILILIVFILNLIANVVRNHYRKKVRIN